MDNMKEIYENPAMEIIDFEGENILTESMTDVDRAMNELGKGNITHVQSVRWDQMNFND